MQIVKLNSTAKAAESLAETINQHLNASERVLWLLSGGSAIKVAIEALAGVSADRKNLTIAQVDERFGPVGHDNSNWQALISASFDPSLLTCIPILSGADPDQTAQNYSNNLKRALSQSDFSIGLFGIGLDGHTAGILPHSPAGSPQELVSHYQWSDFYRITITAKVIRQLDQAVAYVQGSDKQTLIRGLEQEQDPSDQPAQLLKQAKRFIVYNVA